ncbi:5-carboxymethyl-2-hydroxymuconate Delta-isomerase [Actinomadura kijaniata]|uniref:5-carboxymethyl-2-hydroxymuconate Delta-isomerase n=1 Tax=Actinomadura kijaniata TaxID=46161 RepID=UPI00083772AC|nr:hypothetical protein [Actinomadura kijaniata]
MPQITIEYSAVLADLFDRRGFALALHPAASELIGSPPADFKTRFHALDEVVIGDGGAAEAMVHADVAILPGRAAAVKERLGALTLETLCRFLGPESGRNTQVTVEVRDIAAYHKRVLPQ